MMLNAKIGYRALLIIDGAGSKFPDEYWFSWYRSYGGEVGVYESVDSLKRSLRGNGYSKNQYEIWKFHIGLMDNKDSPWFPPEKVEDAK